MGKKKNLGQLPIVIEAVFVAWIFICQLGHGYPWSENGMLTNCDILSLMSLCLEDLLERGSF